jgi:hypothetical protein
MGFILQYIDLIWLPVMLLVVHKKQRLMVGGLFLACALMMRLQVELIESTGFSSGFLPLLESSAQTRGFMVYSVFYMLYVILAIFSAGTKPIVFMAASITIFFAAMVVSMIVMVL